MLRWKLRQLKSKKARVRRQAAEILGAAGNRKAVASLVEALNDYDSDVQMAAAEALGRIRDPQAVEPLCKLFKDQYKSAQGKAAEALGRIQDPRAVEPLCEFLKITHLANAEVIEALAGIKGPILPILKLLQHEEVSVRAQAAEVLGRRGDTEAVNYLRRALRDPHPRVRKEAAKSLDRLHWKPKDEISRAMKLIAEEQWGEVVYLGKAGVEFLTADFLAWRDADWLSDECRVAIADALGKIGDNRAIAPLREALEKDEKNQMVLEQTARSLEFLGWQPVNEAERAAVAVMRRDWEEAVRIGGHAVEVLATSLNNSDPAVRESAVRALGRIGDPRALAPLAKSLIDKSSSVRAAAQASLGRIDADWKQASEVEAIVSEFLKLLASGDSDLSGRAELALAVIGDKRAVGGFIDRLEQRASWVAAKALADMGELDILRRIARDYGAEPTISRTLARHEQQVREAANKALRKSAEETKAPSPEVQVNRRLISAFAGNLQCQYCASRHGTNFWPEHGDMVPFYFQKDPGKFSLKVSCPHCGRDWYVVWDQSPGEMRSLEADGP